MFCRLTDIRSYVVENQRAKENLEKQIHVVSDDLRSIKNKLDSQQSEFNTIASELRLCSRQLEEENKLHVLTVFFTDILSDNYFLH